MQLDRHQSNSRSRFTTSLDINNLGFLGNESLEVAIQSIKLDTSAYNVIESINAIPDIVLYYKKASTNDYVNLFIQPDCNLTPINSDDEIDYQNKSYLFDARKINIADGSFTRTFTQDDCTKTGFKTITILLDRGRNTMNMAMLQLVFIQKTKISSFWDFHNWFQPLLQSNTFQFQNRRSTSIFIGENLAKYLSPNPGNRKKTGRRLVDILNIDEDKIDHDLTKEILTKSINYDYIKLNKKSILTTEESLLKPILMGIRSNIAIHSIRNNIYDQIVAVFNINNLSGVREIEFKDPIFYPTSKEKLCNATFEIIDFLTNERPYFDVGSPTIINCVIRTRMKENESFSVMLDSSCHKSKTLYDDNTPTNFRIELAERIILPENWGVSLKSLFLTNNLYNINSDKFFMSYEEEYRPGDGNLPLVEYGPPRPGRRMPERYYLNELQGRYEYHVNFIPIKPGSYKNLSQLVDAIQESFDEQNIRLNITTADDKTITIKTKSDVDGGTFKLKFSPYLSFTLGLTSDLQNVFEKSFQKSQEIATIAEARLKMLNPKYIMVCADIVDETIFSGEQVKLLRMLVNTENNEQHVLNFDFLHPDIKSIKNREFSSIHITITDITGNPIMTDSFVPTLLQLQFESHNNLM